MPERSSLAGGSKCVCIIRRYKILGAVLYLNILPKSVKKIFFNTIVAEGNSSKHTSMLFQQYNWLEV